MEITSNVIGKLEKIRGGSSFNDSLVIITEIIQNSQRAKANNVHVKLEGDTLSFADDGCGCKKPESILTLDYSEWDSTDEGFGIGLWSWLALPEVESIEIKSHDWVASMNTEDLFKTRNPKAVMEKVEARIKGFQISIKSPYLLDWYNATDIKNRVKSDMETQLFQGYFNGEVIEKVDLHESVGGVFNKYFSTNLFKATLAVARYESPVLYYENREVNKVHYIDSVAGVIEMRPKALMLKEPDRKSYTRDDKARAFEKRLEEARRELYIDFIKQAKEEDVNNYADTIDRVLDVSDYERFIFIDDEKPEIIKEERNLDSTVATKIHSVDRLNQTIDSFNKNNQLTIDDSEFTEDAVVQVAKLLNDVNKDDNSKWVIIGEADCSGVEMLELTEENLDNLKELDILGKKYQKVNLSDHLNHFEVEDEEIITKDILSIRKKPKKEKKSLVQVIRSTPRKVWVKASEAEYHKDLISKAEYYKVKVFIAKNILEERVFQNNDISYISAIDSGIQKTNISKDVFLKTNKERYFIELLQPILSYYKLPFNTFKLGYLKMYIETTLDGVVINREIIENTKNEIKICGVTDGRDIILDRRAMGLQRFNLTEGNIGINEIKALMANLKTISHELAHLLYETEDNTKYHSEMEDMIYEEIVNLYLTI